MKKKITVILVSAVIVIAIVSVVLSLLKKPYKDLTADSIVSARVTFKPDGTEVPITDTEAFAQVISSLKTHGKYKEYGNLDGQTVTFEAQLTDGEMISVSVLSPYVSINGTGYKVSDGQCEELSEYARSLVEN